MGTYGSTDAVNILLGPHKIVDGSVLSLTDLEKILVSIDAELDAKLGTVGVDVLPVVDPAFRTYLGLLASWSATAQALKIQFPEQAGLGGESAWSYWEGRYQGAFAALGSAQGVGGAVPDDLVTTRQVSSYFTQHPEEEAELGRLAGAHLFEVDNLREKPW